MINPSKSPLIFRFLLDLHNALLNERLVFLVKNALHQKMVTYALLYSLEKMMSSSTGKPTSQPIVSGFSEVRKEEVKRCW